MKDAYSFDRDDTSLEISYNKMYNAYKKIFDRLDINYKIVKASVGAMGGTLSEEFQAITDIGEDTLVLCDKCDYASNLEVSSYQYFDNDEEYLNLDEVNTPNYSTIEEVSNYLNLDVTKTVKALLMNVDGKLTIFFVRGDRELNEGKALKLLEAKEIGFADDELIANSNAYPGFTGPIGLEGARIVIDEEILHMKNFCVGANKKDYHYINANVKDFKYDIVGNITDALEGDICPKCGGKLYYNKGIEIGNTFKLGQHYAKDLGLIYLDENNKECIPTMGCYGIGPGRVLTAIIEQNNDDNGMILPMNIAPYQVCIVATNTKDENIMKYANELHDDLEKYNIEVLLDDRDERPGVKFKDMDLIGIPIRVTIGKKLTDNLVELKLRKENESSDISKDEIISKIIEIIKDNKK